jgi:hypothetical protein
MTKRELINITLKQLEDSFKTSPECFQTDDIDKGNLGPMIMWHFRVVIDGKSIPDPNNTNRTVVIIYSALLGQLICNIYLRDVANFSVGVASDASSVIDIKVPLFDSSYRRFNRLRDKILMRKQDLKDLDFLSKLTSIFPTTHDDDLLF